MRKLLPAGILLLVSLSGLHGQIERGATITGTVVSRENGEALAGATIAVEGTLLGTSSDTHGKFLLRRVPPGRQTLVTSLIGSRATRLPPVASGRKTVPPVSDQR